MLQAELEPKTFAPADIIVVLGAGMDADGTLHPSSILRVEKAVKLFQAGAAPRLHFSGGEGILNGPAAGDKMAELAVSLGVPRAAISTENHSFSTLQNALFSMPALQNADRIILVTEGFHLARAWLSFHWAAWQSGRRIEIALAHSTIFRGGQGWSNGPKLLAREVLAIWFNLTRVGLWHIGGALGVEPQSRTAWLR